MSGPAFTIIADDVSEPLVARKWARTEGLGHPSLAEAFNRVGSRGVAVGSRGVAISMRDFFPTWGLDTTLEGGASFPDDSVLLMIGNTEELVRACKEAEEEARILAIYTKTQSALTLLYARIDVSWTQTDTLIAIGPAQGLLLSASQDWREYRWPFLPPPTYVTTPDSEPSALSPVIGWIKRNDGKAWLKT
jgi:hypothetical protein